MFNRGGRQARPPLYPSDPMNPRILSLLAACILTIGPTASQAEERPVRLHTLDEMNTAAAPLNSHAGAERYSVLESVRAYRQLLPAAKLKTDRTAIYPRIKRMADGRYILFVQGGQIASRIYYCTSDDLLHWSDTRILFEPYAVTTSEGSDTRCFSTVDAVVLADGDLLAACSFRAAKGYKHNVGCGIMLRRSRDNGATWSDEEVIFEGTNWEPYLLQLPDGRIQCYFTDCLPATRNSGTSVITSTDNGRTWHGHMRVCRQYKYDDKGVRIFTDQMPCFRLLNDGKTLFGFLEARLEPDGPQGSSIYTMSVVRNRGFDWQPLGENTAGPADRETNLFKGCAGYVSTFPSGEIVVSCNIDRLFSLKIGDSRGRVFNGRSWDEDWYRPFDGKGFWGSLEPMDAHRVIGTMHCDEGIQIGVFYLNHRIDAPKARIRPDGDGREWRSDQALFIGSDSPTETIFRACHDGKRLYLLAEQLDPASAGGAEIRLSVGYGGRRVDLTVASDGSVVSPIPGIRGASRAGLTPAGVPGRATEIAVPLAALQARPGDTLRFNATVRSGAVEDGFTAATDDPETWMRIELK